MAASSAALAVSWLCFVLIASTKGQLILTIQELFPPSPPVTLEVITSRDISLVPGQSYRINCTSNSGFNGQTQDIWTTSGAPVPIQTLNSVPPATTPAVYAILMDPNDLNEWSLVLQVFNGTMTGSFTCSSGAGGNSATLNIDTGNPIVIASTPVLEVREGGTQGNRPFIVAFISPLPVNSSQITWTFNDSPALPDGVLEDRNELVFPASVPTAVEGNYTCTVVTSQGPASAVFIIIVAVQPSVTIAPSDTQVRTIGTSLTITCVDSIGSPPPVFTWCHTPLSSNDTFPIASGVVNIPNQSMLELASLRREDAGEYRCIATNSAGSNSKTVTLQIQHPPIVEQFSSQTEWVLESDAILQARLIASNPPVSSTVWLRDGSPLAASLSSEEQVGGAIVYTLTLRAVGLADEGSYTLEATNSIDVGTVDIPLVVIVPPMLTPAGGSFLVYAALGSTARLSFTVTLAKPPVTLANLSLVDQSIQDGLAFLSFDETTDTATVELQMLELSNSGSYVVMVAHRADDVSINFELRVRNPPAPPGSLSAMLLPPCQAVFSWAAPPSPDNVNTTLPADFVRVEVMLLSGGGGGGGWMEVGRTTGLSQLATLPGSGPDTAFRARVRSGSERVPGEDGLGGATEAPNEYTTYPDGQFPTVFSPRAVPFATSNQLQVSWVLPSDDTCFSFVSYAVSCSPSIDRSASSNAMTISAASALSVNVTQLTPNTQYDCTVSSVVTDRVFRSFTEETSVQTNATFTFPPAPAVPERPKAPPTAPPTTTTITVEFAPHPDADSISHYQVIVLRLTSKDSLPFDRSPDDLYQLGFNFANYSEVHPVGDGISKTEEPYIAAELSAEEFVTTFTIGVSQRADALGYLNGALAPNTPYSCFLRAFPRTLQQLPSSSSSSSSGGGDGGRKRRQAAGLSARQYTIFSSSPFLEAISTESQSPSTGRISPEAVTGISAAVGSVIGLLIISAAVIVILLLCHRYFVNRRKFRFPHSPSVEESSVNSDGMRRLDDFKGTDTPDLIRRGVSNGIELKDLDLDTKMADCIPSGPIAKDDFAKHVEKFDSNRQLLFQEEFEWLTAKSPWRPAEASEHPLNDSKNRYSNITAFDHSRVRLELIQGDDVSDYINANFIAGHKGERQYISSQGPLDQTVEDFWRMVWEQKVATIVMLTNLVELGKVKCSQYWPVSDSEQYGEFQVTLEHSVVLPDYTIRSLTVQSVTTAECRRVLQFHYTKWPDYGTPKLATPLLNFLRAVHSSNPGSSGPLLVHCSAGVGRSGTVLSIDHCLQQMAEDSVVDIRGFVSGMREQRNYMVQTEQQYVFIHYAVLEALMYGDTSFPLSSFANNYKRLQEVSPASGQTLLEEEFHRLGTVKTMVKKSSFQQKVKQKGAPPRHFNSSFISSSGSGSATMWYNAHFIDSYFEPKLFVVADGPTLESAARFWQMVWDDDCSYIVMLTPLDTDYYGYWPPRGGKDQHGKIVVEVEEEVAEHLYTCRKIRLTNAKVGSICHSVKQFQFIGWTTQFLPPVPTFVSFVCDILKGVETLEKNQRLLLHDTSSLGPSGIFTALCYCIERLRVERVVDVFQTVQRIQLQRPGMIQSMQQYAFVYDCVYEFIRTHSTTSC